MAIRTNKTSIGLRVWLKIGERASIERESAIKEAEPGNTDLETIYDE